MPTTDEQYPTLTEMGITRFDEISHYRLHQEGQSKDVLRVYYRRAKGSLLPTSRKYNFGRAVKAVRSEGPSDQTKDIYEISPFVLKAVAELDSIRTTQKTTVDTKAQLIEELKQVEEEFSARMGELRAIAEKL